MSSITFTMLGLSGTGKPHACKSLFYMMERDKSDHKVYLTATGKTVQEKLQNTHFIRNYAPETRDQFTCSGTEGVWELPLALCVGYRQGLPTWPILNAPIRDYAGGIVKTIASGMRDDVDWLCYGRQRTVILMLTKCDSNLIPEQLAADDFQGLMARAATVFSPIVRVCEQNNWPFAIVPTSACGNGNSYTRREDFGRYESSLDAAVWI